MTQKTDTPKTDETPIAYDMTNWRDALLRTATLLKELAIKVRSNEDRPSADYIARKVELAALQNTALSEEIDRVMVREAEEAMLPDPTQPVPVPVPAGMPAGGMLGGTLTIEDPPQVAIAEDGGSIEAASGEYRDDPVQ